MEEIKKIIELLEKWSEYKSITRDDDLISFGKWLSGYEFINNESSTPVLKTGNRLSDEYSGEMQFLASYFLTRMGKFIKIYTKDIFSKHGLSGSDDFSFLALIDKMDKPNKKELCSANITEVTTGMDIIKKLIIKGYATEIIDSEDKRAKRLLITEKGRAVANTIYNELRSVSEDVLGDLNAGERAVIIRFLERLNTYHSKNLMN